MGAVIIIFFVCWCFNGVLITLGPVEEWDGIELVPYGKEFRDLAEKFETGCATFAHKYGFWLQIVAIYRVTGKGKPRVVRSGQGRHLFHGTSRMSARGILEFGFKLPGKYGMFGNGIYFADCPLKSWQYTDGMSISNRSGIILMSWVELGDMVELMEANSSLTASPNRTWMGKLFGDTAYSSVMGVPLELGGSLRVPEFVIYDPAQAEVDYVFEVRRVPQGTPTLPDVAEHMDDALEYADEGL